MKNNPLPRVIGIDEHFFTKKKGYATTIADLTKHRVFGKDRVQVVVMDLSSIK